MTSQKKALLHGTAVAIGNMAIGGIAMDGGKTVGSGDIPASAVLLRGFSGRGKSDLAFRLIHAGATLIADDQVSLERRQESKIFAEPVDVIRGLLEVRGIGLLKFPVAPPTPLRLVVDLVPREDVPRLPAPETVDILGIDIPRLKLHAFDASAAAKIIKAIELVHQPDLLV